MLLFSCKSASCHRKVRQTRDGKCDVLSSHQATASVSAQPTANSPNLKHVCLWRAAKMQRQQGRSMTITHPLHADQSMLAARWYKQQFPVGLLFIAHITTYTQIRCIILKIQNKRYQWTDSMHTWNQTHLSKTTEAQKKVQVKNGIAKKRNDRNKKNPKGR